MKMFTEHPNSVGESYFEHMASAATFSFRLLAGAMCCLLHAVFPFICERTASGIVTDLHDRMVTNRARVRSGPVKA